MSTLLLAFTVISAAPVTNEKPSNRTLFDRTARSTTLVAIVTNGNATHRGTGFVIDADRKWILTNFHVVSDGPCVVTFPQFKDGRVVTNPKAYDLSKGIAGKVIDSDPRCDLALVQLDSLPEEVKSLPIASENPHPGDLLHLVGNPSASAGYWSYTIGRTRGLVRKQATYGTQVLDANAIEAQMDCNNGDSGAPVVNDNGELVGVHSGSHKTAAIRGFAWHIDRDEIHQYYTDAVALSDNTKLAPAPAYQRRAERHLRKNQRDLALADLSRAISSDPGSGNAYRLRSRLNFLRGHNDAALSDAYRAVEYLPHDGRGYNERGNAFYRRGDHRRAIADYTEAVRLLPQDMVVRVNRARAWVARNDADSALKDLTEALSKMPNLLDAYADRGDIHHMRKDYKNAINDFQAGLKVAPGNAGLLARLGHSSLESGNPAQAADAYDKALKANLANPATVWRGLSLARMALRQFDQAIPAYDQAIKHWPKDAELYFGRAAAREEIGDVDTAQGDYAQAAALGHAAAKSLPVFTTRHVRVHNTTQEPIKVFMTYQTRDKDGNWAMIPATGAIEWTIASGQPVTLLLNDKPIEARACRIWATGLKSSKTWDNLKKRTMVLVETPYRARRQDAHTHKFE